MIDEDMAIEVLERLAAATPEAVKPLDDALFLRPRTDRIVVAGVADSLGVAADWNGEEPPEAARWWLSLTSWGRLGMGGDMAAAAEWLLRQAAPPTD